MIFQGLEDLRIRVNKNILRLLSRYKPGQGSVLHSWVSSVIVSHSLPPFLGSITTLLVLDCVPVSHDSVQSDHRLHTDSLQSTEGNLLRCLINMNLF